MAMKTVTLSEDAYAALAALKREGESFSDVVRRLTRTGRSLLEFAGAWKDVPKAKMDRYLAFLEKGDRMSKQKLLRELRGRRGKGIADRPAVDEPVSRDIGGCPPGSNPR